MCQHLPTDAAPASSHLGDVCIRPYRPEDHAAVLEVHRLALEPTGAYLGPGPWEADLDDPARSYVQGGGLFLVGDQCSRIVAIGALRLLADETPPGARVTRMRVLPALQHRGLGRRILAALEAHAASMGVARLVLDTTDRQAAAVALYRSAGYRECKRRRLRGLQVIDMEKWLGPGAPPP